MVVDARAVLDALRAAEAGPTLGAACIFLLACGISSVVWIRMLLAVGYSTSLWNAFRLNLIGFLMNNLIPSGIGGDMWRGWIYSQQAGERQPTLGASLATVIAERWIAFGALALLSIAAVPFALPWLRGLRLPLGAWSVSVPLLTVVFALLMLGAFVVSAALFSPMAERGRGWLTRHALGRGFARHADEFLDGLLAYRGRRGALAGATAVSITSPIVESVAYWLLASAVGIHVSLVAFVVMTPVIRVLHHFPLTVDAAGVQDVALMAMVGAFGLRVEQGLALSLLIHATKVSVSLLGLPLYAWLTLRPAAFGLAAGIQASAD